MRASSSLRPLPAASLTLCTPAVMKLGCHQPTVTGYDKSHHGCSPLIKASCPASPFEYVKSRKGTVGRMK